MTRMLVATMIAWASCGLANAQSGPPDLDAIRADVQRGLHMRTLSQPGYGELLRLSAAKLNRAGATGEAIVALNSVIEQPEGDFDLSEALRQKALYLPATSSSALDAVRSQLAVYDAHPNMKARFGTAYGSGCLQLGSALRAQGRDQEAIAVYQRLTGADSAKVDQTQVQSGFVALAQLRSRAGDAAGAAAEIDHLFERCPNYGRDDGAAVSLRLMRARLSDPSKQSDQYIVAVAAIWNDPHMVATHRVLMAGEEWVQSLIRADRRAEALAAAKAVIDRIDERQLAWCTSQPSASADVASVERTMLSNLQNADRFGRADLALFAVLRLQMRATTPQELESINLQLQRLSPH
jgi:tetratricopeptide (TPR) repeat protein